MDRLDLYNGALRHLGERKLANLSENVEARYYLDDIWDANFVKRLLEAGQWKFAARTSMIPYDPSLTPDFGYKYGFPLPEDFVRTMELATDERFESPLLDYQPEAKVIFCDVQDIYLRYVSDDLQWGADMSLWPESFCEWAEAKMARIALNKLTHSADVFVIVEREEEKLRKIALNRDAMEGQPKRPHMGSWSRSRTADSRTRDGGSRTQLLG